MVPYGLNMVLMRYFNALFLLITFACTSKKTEINKFSDDVVVKIFDYQDKRLSDSLYQYFFHNNAAYRRDAALAFASIQDTSAVEKLAKLLTDENADVRNAAAFALGQTGGEKAFTLLANSPDDSLSFTEVLEAIGKVALDANQLPANISSWGLYRMGLRGFSDSVLIKKAIHFLNSSQPENMRLGAAHFFMRGSGDISRAEQELIEAAQNDKSVYVRMAATSALRKIKTATSIDALTKILNAESDYRVRINAVRALQAFPVSDAKNYLFNALRDSNIHVAIASAEAIRAVATQHEIQNLIAQARASSHWRIQGSLYEAALAVSNSKEISEEVFSVYHETENPYAKAALLTALGQSTIAFGFIHEQLLNTKVAVIKSAAAAALVSINRHKEFDFEMQKIFVDVYKKSIATGDAAVIGTIAAALADSTLGYKKFITNINFLYDAQQKLSLPKDNEALQPLALAIAHFENKKPEEIKNEFNHPINWTLVKTIPRHQKVLIRTNKGDIILRLLVEEAPGSVANFVQLVNDNYFDNKIFHRVVPNFVIQSGCNRGDGWGSEDYSIRSEFSRRRYTEGSVGMASAGKDTEGTQWFITHSPTPHLDGRYTIFALVEQGMDVVHKIEVGDGIIKAELIL
jgi:cyclophilin family peptidyl-prolyl cis-trans isomerase/HEAT repeat protein